MTGELDLAEFSRLALEVCGVDLGDLRPSDLLSDVGLEGMDLLACIESIESRHGIEFPADLMPCFETVDDLLHYTAVKRGQQ